MSRHDPRVSLLQMQDYARRAQGIIGAHTLEDLSKDDVVRLAIERALEVIGEAANRFPAEFRAKYPDVGVAENHRDAQRSDPWLRYCSERCPLGYCAGESPDAA